MEAENIVTVGDAYRLIKKRVQERRDAGIDKPTTWDEWWTELKALAASPINWDFVGDGNEACWREYFNDGNSPAEALEEDISYI
jgi:hypothetical protein